MNQKITLYHGSEQIIESPTFGFGKQNNDFGLGFYCTESEELAKEWAVSSLRNGFVNRYSLDTEYLKILNLKAGILLLITMLPIYLIHLFVGMSFGKGASMGLGIAGSLIAALMITGLGDATWKYIPWAWGVRAMDYTVLAWDSPQLYAQVKTDFFSGMIISVCCTVCLLIASLVWFHGWEGGKNSE